MRATEKDLRERKVKRLRRAYNDAWKPRWSRHRYTTRSPEIHLGERPLPVARLLFPYLLECWTALWDAGLGTRSIWSVTEAQYAVLPHKARAMVYKRMHRPAHTDLQYMGRGADGEPHYIDVPVAEHVYYDLKRDVSYTVVDRPRKAISYITPETDARRAELENQILSMGEHDVYGGGCSCQCCRPGSPAKYEPDKLHIRRELSHGVDTEYRIAV